MKRKILILCSCIVLMSIGMDAQDLQSPKKFTKTLCRDVDMNYLRYLPPGFDESSGEIYPIILFLHGSGERGNDIELVKKHGPPKIAQEMKLPFIIVSPQCPADSWWDIEILREFLEDIIATYPVDTNRIYLTGLSMGGFGAWEFALIYPHYFAAIVPVCGGGNPNRVERLGKMPAWVFHGAKDDVVPISKSEEMVNALKKNGNPVEFTVYPDAGHDSWTETYSNPILYKWLLEQKRQ
nr:prolyl oligopeptidase family serine peptidase [Bacteroidota bacterium]